jgi:hypothetical protein
MDKRRDGEKQILLLVPECPNRLCIFEQGLIHFACQVDSRDYFDWQMRLFDRYEPARDAVMAIHWI